MHFCSNSVDMWLVGSPAIAHARPMVRKREPIDELIDALCWMRRRAWPEDQAKVIARPGRTPVVAAVQENQRWSAAEISDATVKDDKPTKTPAPEKASEGSYC